MVVPESVILLKPDGYANGEVRSLVDARLAELELQVRSRDERVLRSVDVLDFYPKFAAADFPISRQFTLRYLTSGACEVLVVAGDDAPDKTLTIKNDVRARVGSGMFANAMHTPSGAAEMEATVRKARALIAGAAHVRHHEETRSEGMFGRLARVPEHELEASAARVWKCAQADGWTALRSAAPVGKYTLHLLAGDPVSVDYAMSTLAETFRTWSPDDVITAYMLADTLGENVLAAGDERTMELLAGALREMGLYAEVR